MNRKLKKLFRDPKLFFKDMIFKRKHQVEKYLPQPKHQGKNQFTDQRTDTTEDELWIVEHPSVYTQGKAGKAEHLLNPNAIPVNFLHDGSEHFAGTFDVDGFLEVCGEGHL